jgi:hypothetical protein
MYSSMNRNEFILEFNLYQYGCRHPGGVLVGHQLPTFAGGGAQGKDLVAIVADDVG